VAALHDHFGIECSEGNMLCENYMAYFMDRNRRLTEENWESLEKQNERARLVKFLLHAVNVR